MDRPVRQISSALRVQLSNMIFPYALWSMNSHFTALFERNRCCPRDGQGTGKTIAQLVGKAASELSDLLHQPGQAAHGGRAQHRLAKPRDGGSWIADAAGEGLAVDFDLMRQPIDRNGIVAGILRPQVDPVLLLEQTDLSGRDIGKRDV